MSVGQMSSPCMAIDLVPRNIAEQGDKRIHKQQGQSDTATRIGLDTGCSAPNNGSRANMSGIPVADRMRVAGTDSPNRRPRLAKEYAEDVKGG